MRKAALLSSLFTRPRVEELEPRRLLSVAVYTPAQIRHAYGFDQVRNDGTGQTIAIIDAYDDPTITSDLRTFDSQFGLPNPTLIKIMPQGQPPPNADWSAEIALDVEWAHAVAPGANLMLVEAKSSSVNDLMAAVNWARQFPTVSVIAMSWGVDEWQGETGFDPFFTTPAGHGGVTFLASSGDSGMTVNWPATSPNVVAVGGTTLTLADASGTYGAEKGWSGSGGGISAYEHKPGYQSAFQSSAWRTDPDVAYDADPNTAVYVYDSSAPTPGWLGMGGTSAGVPQWAGLIALANQARAQAGKPSLDGASQTLPALYTVAASNFNDITSGSNGFTAHAGYDLVTGRGTPKAQAMIPALASAGGAASAGSPTQSTSGSRANVGTVPAGPAADRTGFDAYPISAPTPNPVPAPSAAALRMAAPLSPPLIGPSDGPAVTWSARPLGVEGARISGDGQLEAHSGNEEAEPVPGASPWPSSQHDGMNPPGPGGAPAESGIEAGDRDTSATIPADAAGTTALTGLLLLLGGHGDGREERRERRRIH